MRDLHIIFTDSDVLLSKKVYGTWREIQDEYEEYKASLGPWDAEEVISWLDDEYSRLSPSAGEQVAAFLDAEAQVCALTFT